MIKTNRVRILCGQPVVIKQDIHCHVIIFLNKFCSLNEGQKHIFVDTTVNTEYEWGITMAA
jgi:hypothetical protein